MPRLHQDESRRAATREGVSMGESRPSEEAIALFTNVFGYAPDPEALHAGECWQAERIDAALRRAKAEVLELAARELCMYCNATRQGQI